MREHVAIVPSDHVVVVDDGALHFSFKAAANIHAIQWHSGQGHIEYTNADTINKKISGVKDYVTYVSPFVLAWEAEKARCEQEEVECNEQS